MRDIRPDIRERILGTQSEIAAAEKVLSALRSRETSLTALLGEEEQRWFVDTSNQVELFEGPRVAESNHAQFSTFLRDTLSDGKPWSLGELKHLALERGVSFEDKSPGRVLHFALIGMAQTGIVEPVFKGVWRMKSKGESMNGVH